MHIKTGARGALVVILTFVVGLAGSTSAFAQARHAVDPSTIGQTVTAAGAQQDADRAAIREALARPEVKSAAASMGVNVDTIAPSIATLSGPDLARAASSARQVNDSLAGGGSVTLSTTLIIIILLVLILLIVALK